MRGEQDGTEEDKNITKIGDALFARSSHRQAGGEHRAGKAVPPGVCVWGALIGVFARAGEGGGGGRVILPARARQSDAHDRRRGAGLGVVALAASLSDRH